MQVAQPDRADWIVRGLALAGFAGILAGVIAGAGSRLAMRIFAIAVHQPTIFTIEGSMAIAFFGLLIGPALAVGYVLVRPVLPGPWPVRGLLFGVALGALVVVAFSGAPVDEAGPDPALAGKLFAGLAVILGPVIALFVSWLDPRMPVPVSTAGPVTGAGALLGVVGALLLSSMLLSALIGLFD